MSKIEIQQSLKAGKAQLNAYKKRKQGASEAVEQFIRDEIIRIRTVHGNPSNLSELLRFTVEEDQNKVDAQSLLSFIQDYTPIKFNRDKKRFTLKEKDLNQGDWQAIPQTLKIFKYQQPTADWNFKSVSPLDILKQKKAQLEKLLEGKGTFASKRKQMSEEQVTEVENDIVQYRLALSAIGG